jgi:hypothetical protein
MQLFIETYKSPLLSELIVDDRNRSSSKLATPPFINTITVINGGFLVYHVEGGCLVYHVEGGFCHGGRLPEDVTQNQVGTRCAPHLPNTFYTTADQLAGVVAVNGNSHSMYLILISRVSCQLINYITLKIEKTNQLCYSVLKRDMSGKYQVKIIDTLPMIGKSSRIHYLRSFMRLR